MKENIYNIPNAITLSRVIITLIIIYAFLSGYSLLMIALLFAVGMLTDFLDGQIARRYKLVTEFGRKFDMIADRTITVITILIFLYMLHKKGNIDQIIEVLLISSREIISLPFAIYAAFANNHIPSAKFIGKLTTLMQSIALPLIIFNMYNGLFSFSIFFSIATCIVGIMSGIQYIKDIRSAK